ncbi:MAG: LTA synthase family protein [Saprospiraceae bacterium]
MRIRKPHIWSALYFPIRLMLVYLVGMTLWKLLFIWYNDVSETWLPIAHGFRLEVSMICGVILANFIPWIFYLFIGKSWTKSILYWWNILLWLFVCAVQWSSVLMYKEWGSTLDSRAVTYLGHPKEAWASVRDFIPFWVSVGALFITIFGITHLTTLIMKRNWHPVRSYYIQSMVFMVLVGGLSFLGLRGGWQKLPIVPSDAFYSSDMKNNFAATNKVWYFIYSTKQNEIFTPEFSTDQINDFSREYHTNDCTQDSLYGQWKDKNMVLLVMEGWSADMVRYLGGLETVTPFFDSMSAHSVRFTNAFSTGYRTDQGLMSVLSGIPSLGSANMPNMIDKVQKYPSLPRVMRASGRQTSFIYGGDLNFSNLYNYLTILGFDTIISDDDFDVDQRSTEWGVPDHITAQKGLDIMSSQKLPFFSTMLFLSSHSPFEVPIPNKWSKADDIPSRYKSSVMYSDESLKLFFTLAQQKHWYANTIFIITADHGSTHSGYAGMEDHQRFRIPLLVFDPSIDRSAYGDIDIPCNHFDLPTTIAEMSGVASSSFVFGRNIFCSDDTRSAYWNTDQADGRFSLKGNEITLKGKNTQSTSPRSALFVDMIRQWFNAL